MKIVILGSNGYIARNVVYMLRRDYPTYELLLYDIQQKSIDDYCGYSQVDMTDKEAVQQIDLSCDACLMFVGKTGSLEGFSNYDTFLDANERALLNLLSEYKRQSSQAKIVFPSTRLVYKGTSEPVSEDSEKEFKTVYAMTKYACEQYLAQFHSMFGIRYCILRICIPYGTLVEGASSYGTVEFMLSKARAGCNINLYGDGSGRRTLTHVEMLCRTIIEAAIDGNCLNDVFNVGGEDYSLAEMAQLISTQFNVGIDFIPWPEAAKKIESGNTVFNSDKLDRIILRDDSFSFVSWIESLATKE